MQNQTPKLPYGCLLYIDHQNQLWLYARGNLSGLYEYDPGSGRLLHFSKDSGKAKLSSNIVNDIIQDDKGLIWIATDQGGLDVMDKERLTIRYLLNSEEERSLAQNSINTLYMTMMGLSGWVPDKKGISYYQENMIRFPLYRHSGRTAGQPSLR